MTTTINDVIMETLSNDILFSPIRLNELERLIQNSVRRALKEAQNSGTVNNPKPSQSDERLFAPEAAKHIGVKLPTLYGKVSHRQIPYHKPPGSKRLIFLRSELDAWLAQGRRKTVKEMAEEI